MTLKLNLNESTQSFLSSYNPESEQESSILSALQALNQVQPFEMRDQRYDDLYEVLVLQGKCLDGPLLKTVIAAFDHWGHKSILFQSCLNSGNEALALKLFESGGVKFGKTALTFALSHGCLGIANLMIGNGVSIDKVVLDGLDFSKSQVTPYKCIQILRFILSRQVDISEAGANLLSKIVKMGDGYLESVRLIINQSISVNTRDENGETALMAACKMDESPKEIIRLLVTRGGNSHEKDEEGDTIIQYLVENDKKDTLVALLNLSQGEAQEYIRNFKAKFIVGHVNSMKESHGMNHEGSDRFDMIKLIKEALEVLPESLSKQIPATHKDQLLKAFSKKRIKDSNTLQAIRNGDLVVLPHGHKNHSLFFVFYKGYMVICNRGREETVTAFKIEPSKFSIAIFNAFLRCGTRSKELANKYYYKILPTLLSETGKLVEKDYICWQLEQSLTAVKQKIGNCSYAAGKLAVRVVLGLLQIQKGKHKKKLDQEALDKSLAISKAISTHIRLKLLNEYYQLQEEEENDFFDAEFAQKAMDLALKHLNESASYLHIQNYPLVANAYKMQNRETP